jgi:hypothetical protein
MSCSPASIPPIAFDVLSASRTTSHRASNIRAAAGADAPTESIILIDLDGLERLFGEPRESRPS